MRLACCLIACLVVPAMASSQPIYPMRTSDIEWETARGGNGSYYEIVSTSSQFTWFDANEYAMNQVRNGVAGHLATLNSGSEERFLAIHIMGIREDQYLFRYLFRDRFYCIGGWNSDDYPPDGGPSGWRWITGEPFGLDLWRPYQYIWQHAAEPVLVWHLADAFSTGLAPAPVDIGLSHVDNNNYYIGVACGLIIEYDGLSVVDGPPTTAIATEQSALGGIKALFR